jgi:hypothetical protein
MRPAARTRILWLQAAVVLLLLGGLVGWLVRVEMKPLGRAELKIEAADLRSYAAAGRLLAEQALTGKTTQAFFQTQTYLLQDKAESATKKLDSVEPKSGLEAQHLQARHLARQVQTALQSLNASVTNPQGMNQAKDELANLFPQLKELEESLKK